MWTNAKNGDTVTNCVATLKAVTSVPALLATPLCLLNTARQTTVSTVDKFLCVQPALPVITIRLREVLREIVSEIEVSGSETIM